VSKNRDLVSLAAAAVLLAALALAVPIEWLSLLLLAPLAFLFSGRAIVAAAFVRRRPPRPQTLVLSVALSLAVLALVSLPLNYLGGLTAASWALGLVLVTLVACGIAALTRHADEGSSIRPPRPPRVAPLSAVLGLIGLLAAAAAIVLAFTPLSASNAVGFTALWMRPVDGAAGTGVRVGVGSEEKYTTSYRLQVHLAGESKPTGRRIVLEPGETKVLRLIVSPPPSAARPAFVTADLYLTGEPDRPYRRVYGWIPAGGE